MWFLSNVTLSTASQCVHWYWKQLTGPWEPVVTSWSKAKWLLLGLISRDSQRAWHSHCLIKCLTSLAIFLCRKLSAPLVIELGTGMKHAGLRLWFKSPTVYTWQTLCNAFFFVDVVFGKKIIIIKFVIWKVLLCALLGGSNGFSKYLCIDVLPQPANI